MTRVCVARISIGVPFGTQVDWLSSNTSGWPFENSRVDPVIHCPVTHGDGAPLTLNGQPAIVYGGIVVTVG